MGLTRWWDGEPSQRYWMEITDRNDLGADLRAPKLGLDGRPKWHYELVREVAPGDIVFHWHRTLRGEPGIVGWSEAIGPLDLIEVVWAPHTAKEGTVVRPSENWRMPLGGLHLLDVPITRSEVLTIRDDIVALEELLRETVPGFGYYPFIRYGDSLRAQQAYLTKCPAELLPLLQQLGDLEIDESRIGGGLAATALSGAAGGQGFLRNAKLRLAIETYAVEVAVDLYRGMGATDIKILGKPYDLRLVLHGVERYVEVKGSRTRADSVLLTKNEVTHARAMTTTTDLVVVDEIVWEAVDDGYDLSGGVVRRWEDWVPTDESLLSMTYSHRLPPYPAHVER